MFRRKSSQLDNILDDCLERLLVKGESIEECLADYPEQADELKPLLQTAVVTKKALVIEPRPEFRAKAGYQFRTALKEIASKKSRPFFAWQLRWATVVSLALILLLAGGGIVAAASNSMPDNPLYQVKLATEQIQLYLTTSPLDKAKLYAKLADRRVTEIINMAQEGNVRLVELTTQRLDNHLAMIASSSTVQREEISLIGEALETPALVVDITEADVKSAEFSQPLNGSKSELEGLLEEHSANNTAALYEALETAPEEVKLALIQAIEVSVAGYEQALAAIGE